MSRLDYGKRYCLHSPTLDEEPLQQAVLAAINAAMSDHEALVAQITDAMEQELAPIPGEGMSLGDIERAIEELGKQFDVLLLEASNAVNTEEYAERFRAISNMIEELKRRKGNILQICQEQEQIKQEDGRGVSDRLICDAPSKALGPLLMAENCPDPQQHHRQRSGFEAACCGTR